MVVTLCFGETCVGAFLETPETASGQIALSNPESIGENYDASRYDASGYAVAPRTALNRTSTGNYTNLRPGDAVQLQGTPRTLVQDGSGRYWLQSANGNRVTPSGSYDFVTLPNGTTRVARTNTNPGFSTHLGLSGGGEVRYAGSIRFSNNSSGRPSRGVIREWSNSSGHYQPAAGDAANAGLPTNLFRAYE